MKFSLFTANSVDGNITKEDGNVDLLHASGEPDSSIGEHFDNIFRALFYSIDCMFKGGNGWSV